MSKLDTSIENMTREQLIAEISMLNENCSKFSKAFDSMSDILINVDNEFEAKVAERTKDLQRTQTELSICLENEKILGELKSRFVSTASHQFRTPLTVIQSNMGILSMQKGLMDDALKVTFEKINNRIITQVGWMTTMMNDLLILGKIDLSNIVLELEPIDLVGLCGEVIVNYNEIQDDNRNMTLTVIGKPSTLELDANLITHAISNLVSNAFKYSENKPAPRMKLVFNEQSTQLSIIDYGLGIPEEDIINLFEPFYRASNVTEVSGTGLGTTIAKEYVELNQGSIKVKSTLLEGTEFILTF
ncbi:MAG: HAMP domain-containing histidine kinase [Crocinitomicaceae bacterium]|nr:HAMP domain-containing histidine kinase [Flavobacteriales bacterium]NQZ35702.1 HAMP domain-containing histidine kinase [Crocinitomicaceae bacterium]